MSEDDKALPGGGSVYSPRHAKWLLTSWRKLMLDPDKILPGLVREGDTVADIGCGPGYFTLPMARLVGGKGLVVAVDLQQEMLDYVTRRAGEAGLSGRIRTVQCATDSLVFTGPVDFLLASNMIHEVPDVVRFMEEAFAMVRPGGRMLVIEQRFHVSGTAFRKTVELALEAGFTVEAEPRYFMSMATLFNRALKAA